MARKVIACAQPWSAVRMAANIICWMRRKGPFACSRQGFRAAVEREVVFMKSYFKPFPWHARLTWIVVAGFFLMAVSLLSAANVTGGPKRGPEPLLFVVMDPLAKELACACVEGYGQRDYRKLAALLEK